MRVVHLCTEVGSGGAANSMLNLHKGLLAMGVDSWIFAKSLKEKDPHFIECRDPEKLNTVRIRTTKQLLADNRSSLSNTHYSFDLIGASLVEDAFIQSADIINLHWVANFLSAASLAELLSLNKPVVWTLHDMRPLTGGCHFSAGCQRYVDGCHECPQLLIDYGHLSQKCQEILSRVMHESGIHLVAPSSWMLGNVKTSRTMVNCESSQIGYGIDTTIFKTGEKNGARNQFGLSEDIWYILLASHNLKEIRKGAGHVSGILKCMNQDPMLSEAISSGKLRILCCGHEAEFISFDGWQIDCVGHVDPEKMPLLYQSADVLLFTSLEDNLPNVVMEAMACGLPVVSHDLEGVIDLIGEEASKSAVFTPGDSKTGAEMIMSLYKNREFAASVTENGIRRIQENFSLSFQAARYHELYARLLTKESSAPKVLREEIRYAEFQALIAGLSDRLERVENKTANQFKDIQAARILQRSLWVKLGQLFGICHR